VSRGSVVRRVLVVIALLLLGALAWLGLTGGVRQVTMSQGVGQKAQTLAQLGYGLLSLLSIFATLRAPRWAAVVLAGWAASLTMPGTGAPRPRAPRHEHNALAAAAHPPLR
jgi:hypothetical protein